MLIPSKTSWNLLRLPAEQAQLAFCRSSSGKTKCRWHFWWISAEALTWWKTYVKKYRGNLKTYISSYPHYYLSRYNAYFHGIVQVKDVLKEVESETPGTRHRPSLDRADVAGWTPLHVAARMSRCSLVVILLKVEIGGFPLGKTMGKQLPSGGFHSHGGTSTSSVSMGLCPRKHLFWGTPLKMESPICCHS